MSDLLRTAPALERRRGHLLESALLVISRKGYHDARIEDVCTAAGISRATFYRYFDSKDSLFDALVDLMSTEVINIAGHLEAVTPDAAGYDTICVWVRDLVENTKRWGSVVSEIIRPRDEHAAARNQAILVTTSFSQILGDRFREGGVEDDDFAMAALAIIAMVERVAVQLTTWNVELDEQRLVPALATMSLKMLHPNVRFAGG